MFNTLPLAPNLISREIDFKRQAVELVIHSGRTQAQIARELGVSEYSLTLWKRAYLGNLKPVGTAAAVACPDRKVVCLEGDGSAMYTLQALWTQARESLGVTTVIYANRSYAILHIELARVGVEIPG
jgi:thiamine pyrophosphate-dependent acetolactate synthase large subunit-like protein